MVAEAGEVDEAVRKVLAYKPAVIVLDLSMPGGSSLAAIPRMLEASPDTAVVVLTKTNQSNRSAPWTNSSARSYARRKARCSMYVQSRRECRRPKRILIARLATSNRSCTYSPARCPMRSAAPEITPAAPIRERRPHMVRTHRDVLATRRATTGGMGCSLAAPRAMSGLPCSPGCC